MKYKLTFSYLCEDVGINGEDEWVEHEIETDILLLSHDFMIINDLSNIYINQWELHNLKDLKIEIIKN